MKRALPLLLVLPAVVHAEQNIGQTILDGVLTGLGTVTTIVVGVLGTVLIRFLQARLHQWNMDALMPFVEEAVAYGVVQAEIKARAVAEKKKGEVLSSKSKLDDAVQRAIEMLSESGMMDKLEAAFKDKVESFLRSRVEETVNNPRKVPEVTASGVTELIKESLDPSR